MALERKKTLNVFKEAAAAWGSYDEFPVGPKGTDPMPHLSRSRVAQPFFVICEADQVLIQMAGQGALQLDGGAQASLTLAPGDTVYIPAGLPSRVVPAVDSEVLQVRLKAEPPAREAVAWYCRCGQRLRAVAIDIESAPLQEGWWRAVETFNSDEKLRLCAHCGAVHAPVELGDIAWLEVAAAMRAED